MNTTTMRRRVAALEDRIAPKGQPKHVALLDAETDAEEAAKVAAETERATAAGLASTPDEVFCIVLRSPRLTPRRAA